MVGAGAEEKAVVLQKSRQVILDLLQGRPLGKGGEVNEKLHEMSSLAVLLGRLLFQLLRLRGGAQRVNDLV